MPKRNVTFSKPSEPSFLRKLKEQAGYKEGPTVDTKREQLEIANFEDFVDAEEEQPTVVVLKPGDLSAEEADQIKKSLEKEANEAPADLNTRIVFKAPSKDKKPTETKEDLSDTSLKRPRSSKDQAKQSKKLKSKPLLSFNDDEEDETDN